MVERGLGTRLHVSYTAVCHLQPCCLVEVGRADALADNVPLCARGDQRELLLVHDILQLLTYLTNLHNNQPHQIRGLKF